MIIAHLSAGYLLATATNQLTRTRNRAFPTAMIIGSVLPDFDILYFYLISSQHHHHSYFTHWPLFWLTLCLIGWVLSVKRPHMQIWCIGLAIGTMLHLMLDSITGQVPWLAPFSMESTTLVDIPATHDHWLLSFMTHWTFAIEVALVITSLVVLAVQWRKKQTAPA